MDRQLNICDLEVVLRFIGHLLEVMLTKAVSFALNRQWFRCIIRYFATSILKIITQCFFMVFCVYHSFFQLASFYRIKLFQPCIKAFPYRHFCFQTSVFSLFRSKVTELLFQEEPKNQLLQLHAVPDRKIRDSLGFRKPCFEISGYDNKDCCAECDSAHTRPYQ